MSRHALLTFLMLLCQPMQAAPPSASVLPGTTKLHISIPDVQKLETAWKKTKLSQVFGDPKLKPFLDDLLSESALAKLGLGWADLESVAAGELSLAIVQVAPGQAGQVLRLDATGKKLHLVKLLAKVAVGMEKQGYKIGVSKIGGYPVTTYTRADKDKNERRHVSFMKDEVLVAADNDKVVVDILERWAGTSPDRLDQKKAYQEVVSRAKSAGELFWFLEPIGLAETLRGAARTTPRRGPDMLKILKQEGFTALQGVGGFLSVGQGDYELLQKLAIYAPGPYQKSMRMVQTLPGANFAPPDWVPGDASVYATAYADLSTAFNNFGSLFDSVYGDGDTGTFDDVLKGLRDDPSGPQVDVGKEVFGRLGQRVTLVSDLEKPIALHSPRTLLAVETKDEKGLARAIRLLMENDEDVKPRTLSGDVVLWEVITREKKKKALKPKLPNSALAVARGHLFLANNVKVLDKILTSPDKGLAAQYDYQRVVKEMDSLGAGKDCLRVFSRPDQDLQTVYEMLRTNQLDKSSSIYARLLIALFGDSVLQIDGSQLPDYEHFRPYLGPLGIYGVHQPDGWLVVGCALRPK